MYINFKLITRNKQDDSNQTIYTCDHYYKSVSSRTDRCERHTFSVTLYKNWVETKVTKPALPR